MCNLNFSFMRHEMAREMETFTSIRDPFNIPQERYREDPNTFTKEISDLEALRANACIRPTQDFAGVANVQRYYSQLQFLKNRFKVRYVHFLLD